jgi:hypothetical protein
VQDESYDDRVRHSKEHVSCAWGNQNGKVVVRKRLSRAKVLTGFPATWLQHSCLAWARALTGAGFRSFCVSLHKNLELVPEVAASLRRKGSPTRFSLTACWSRFEA